MPGAEVLTPRRCLWRPTPALGDCRTKSSGIKGSYHNLTPMVRICRAHQRAPRITDVPPERVSVVSAGSVASAEPASLTWWRDRWGGATAVARPRAIVLVPLGAVLDRREPLHSAREFIKDGDDRHESREWPCRQGVDALPGRRAGVVHGQVWRVHRSASAGPEQCPDGRHAQERRDFGIFAARLPTSVPGVGLFSAMPV